MRRGIVDPTRPTRYIFTVAFEKLRSNLQWIASGMGYGLGGSGSHDRGLPYWPDGAAPPADIVSRPFVGPIPAAQAAVDVLADLLSTSPLVVAYDSDPVTQYWQARMNHPVTALLRYPSRQYSPVEFWRMMFEELYSSGNAYARIVRSGGEPVELELVVSLGGRWVQDPGGRRARVARRVRPLGRLAPTELMVWDSELVSLHTRGFNGIESPSPIAFYARGVLEGMSQAVAHNISTLRRGLHSNRALVASEKLLETDGFSHAVHAELKKLIEKEMSGAINAGKTPVLHPGYTVSDLGGFSAIDLELIELLRFGIEDIARIWNIPPLWLHHSPGRGGGARKPMTEETAHFFERYSIRGRAAIIGSQLSAKLLDEQDRTDSLSVKVVTDRIGEGSRSERIISAELAATRGGLLTINEARRSIGYDDRDDGDRLLSPKGSPPQGGNLDGGGEGENDDDDDDD